MTTKITVEIPARWVLIMPCGCVCGVAVGAFPNGQIICATADQAFADFYDTKRDRERHRKAGYHVRAEEDGDWEAFTAAFPADGEGACKHPGRISA